ncbi:hypothetical protein GW17_00015785 [Ensete ventricosum]|nr:hypothetical protein GW17_00015785 [Ensete ventricosum]
MDDCRSLPEMRSYGLILLAIVFALYCCSTTAHNGEQPLSKIAIHKTTLATTVAARIRASPFVLGLKVVDQRSLSRKYLSIMVRSWGKSWKSPEIWKCYINNYERETAAGRVHFDAGRNQGSWQRKIAAGSVMQRGIAAGRDQVAAGRNQSRWQREIAATAMKTDGSEGSLLVAFVPQRIAAGRDQGGWQQESAASSIVQREMRAAVEGIREVGWLKGWWTEGCGFWGLFCDCFGCGFVEFWLQIGRVLGLRWVWMKVRERDFRFGVDGSKGLIEIGGGMLRIGAGCRRLRF